MTIRVVKALVGLIVVVMFGVYGDQIYLMYCRCHLRDGIYVSSSTGFVCRCECASDESYFTIFMLVWCAVES